ncbi:MAG: protein ral secretion pathway protein [Candidatus Parcubacteria bacterium]
MLKSYKRGFTLIELLVVIAIIGILASIVLASLDSARKKGRDARRIADIKQIQLAIELFYDSNNLFPSALSAAGLVTPGYISTIPSDPSAGSYSYVPYSSGSANATCTSYHLGASLESQGHTAFATDTDATTTPSGYAICTRSTEGSPAASDFSGSDTAKCESSQSAGYGCYDVRPLLFNTSL